MQRANTMPKQDTWVRSICDSCHHGCGTLVHRVDGVVVDIKGDPDCPANLGKLCAKGWSSVMGLYDPSRVKTPLKRTNPEKGLDVDPGWVPISWDEALDILVEKLSPARKEKPRNLVRASFAGGVFGRGPLETSFFAALGSPSTGWGGYFCGNYWHAAMYLTTGSFRPEFDLDYCNYLVIFGSQIGSGTGHDNNIVVQKMAKARKRGMKTVVVDPLCTPAASKADEWLPIRPGTDSALIFAMMNVLLNELDIYDREFIKRYTNGPYLVKPDGYYARREGKPLVWDAREGTAKTYDAEVKDYTIETIEGSLLVDGIECLPAFHLLREHVKKYTPEMAAEITTIPASTIRRVAENLGREARIGSTIVVEGKEFPYRPAAVYCSRGGGAHKHGVAYGLGASMINAIIGSFYVPGGHRGMNIVGPSWEWQPRQTDGLVIAHEPLGGGEGGHVNYYDWKVGPPTTQSLSEFFPISSNKSPVTLLTSLEPEKYGLSKPEVLVGERRNLFLSGVNHKITEKALRKYDFIVIFSLLLDEMTQMADLVLPELHTLEETTFFIRGITNISSMHPGYWLWGTREAVVPPPGEAREIWWVLTEVADRMGILDSFYQRFNEAEKLKEPYKLDPSRKYSRAEVADRMAKSLFGEEKGLEWFQEHGWLGVKVAVDELYPLPWLKVRFPIYFENILRAGSEVGQVTQDMGLKEWDVSDYQALPDWKPCPAYNERSEFDLYAFNFRVATHAFSWTAQNPWLSELAELNPYAQRIIINTQAAKKKGIKDGDRVYVESAVGKVVGNAKVTECVHPETVGISGHFGSLVKGKPVAYGKGANFNNLLPFGLEAMDMVSTGVDACVRVKVYKV